MPKVSVIMSVYNCQMYVRESIESILGQTLRNWEFIIVNDASTDSTRSMIEGLISRDSRITLINNETNLERVYSRNKAARLARAEYIAIVDADDISLPQRLEKQVIFLGGHPEISLVGSNFQVINEKGTHLSLSDLPIEDGEIRKKLISGNCFAHSAMMFRKDSFIRVGRYRPGFEYVEDYDLVLRMAEHYKLANIKEPLIKWRMSCSGTTAKHAQEMAYYSDLAKLSACKRSKGDEITLARVKGKSFNEDPKAVMAKHYHSLGRVKFFYGFHSQARGYFIQALKLDPFVLKNYVYLALSLLPASFTGTLRRAKVLVARAVYTCGLKPWVSCRLPKAVAAHIKRV